MTSKKHKGIFCLVFLMFVIAFGGPGEAASKAFPEKPVSFMVMVSPGGGFDTYARAISGVMGKHLGVPVIVKNVPGAGHRKGATLLYRSKPNGYSIGIFNTQGLFSYQLFGEQKVRYDMTKFTWIGRAAIARYLLCVGKKSPYKNIDDLKKSGKPIKLSDTGRSSTSALASMLLFSKLGLPLEKIYGYKGASEMIVAAIQGDADGMLLPLSTLFKYVKSGDLKPIVLFSEQRDPLIPEVPTVGELGHEDLLTVNLQRLIGAPPGVPKDRVKILEDVLKKTMNDEELTSWSKKAGRPLDPASPKEATQLVNELRDLLTKNADLIKKNLL